MISDIRLFEEVVVISIFTIALTYSIKFYLLVSLQIHMYLFMYISPKTLHIPTIVGISFESLNTYSLQ